MFWKAVVHMPYSLVAKHTKISEEDVFQTLQAAKKSSQDKNTIVSKLTDDMLFKTAGKSSSTLLKTKRDKLREDRFKE